MAEFKTEDKVTTITNSLLRGELDDGFFYKFFYSYNPSKHKQSWVNKKYESAFVAKNTFVHHSTYHDNRHNSKQFIEEAESAKERNEFRYRWEYLGEAIGSGVVPFSNLTFRPITDDEMAKFDNIRQGIDFGYATDPLAFVRWNYDKIRNRIYLLHGVKISNCKLAEWILSKGYQTHEIIADSTEPTSTAENLRELGVKHIVGAKKEPDSVEYGECWLDYLEIIIDPKRTPHTAKEFEDIDYQTDKDGNPKPRLEDKKQPKRRFQ